MKNKLLSIKLSSLFQQLLFFMIALNDIDSGAHINLLNLNTKH